MTIAETLNKAADFLGHPGAWTQMADARDRTGRLLEDANDSEAMCWCIEAAIERVAPSGGAWPVLTFLDGYLGEPAVRWNDAPGRTQQEVLVTLRDAARAAVEAGR